MIKQITTTFPQPFYYISFSIISKNGEECSFRTLFSNELGSFKYYVEREMRGFRDAGWSLPKNVQYIIQLNGIEYKDDATRVQILENGHIIIQGAVSESFLCWANSSRKSTLKGDRTQINTTALIEFTYNCVALLNRALQDCEMPEEVVCEFGFIGMDSNYVLGDEKLPSQDLFTHSWSMNPIGNDTEANLRIKPSDIISEEGVAKITYSILAPVYRMFGFSEDIISYTDTAADRKKINIKLMKGAK